MTIELEGMYKHSPLIQRLEPRNQDRNVMFSRRYYIQYMGSAEFENGCIGKRIRQLHTRCTFGEVLVAERTVRVVYDPSQFDLVGVYNYLNALWNGDFRAKEWTNFNRQSQDKGTTVKAWMSAEYGLFWTLEVFNIYDLASNLALSVNFMDEAPPTTEPVTVREEPVSQFSSAREYLIKHGKLIPAKDGR